MEASKQASISVGMANHVYGNGEIWHNLPILDCFSSGEFVGVTEN